MRSWIRFIILPVFVAMAVSVFAQDRPAYNSGKIKLTKKNLYFTEPYIFLKPPINDEIAMSLELDYTYIKYPLGFVNTLDSKEPLIQFQKRVRISDPEQLARLIEKSGFNVGDKVTVISSRGMSHPARIVSFSYVGNSPSTIIVAADLKISTDNPDPALFSRHGIALRGVHNVPARGDIASGKALSTDDPLRQKLLNICATDLPPGHVIQDVSILPATLERGGSPYYFVSYWQRPETDFEIDEVKISACMLQGSGESWSKASLPFPLRLLHVHDLDNDGKAEIFAQTGDGTEVCYIYLVPKEDHYQILKKGLCAGY